jgi:predicted amidohydrolase YtcJ
MNKSLLAAIAVSLAAACPASAQPPDTVLLNGKILTVDPTSSTREALAIRGGRIIAVGTTADIRRLAASATQVIDLQGRTVVPGLIDSHMHAIRAAQFFATEVNWIGAPTLSDALARMRAAAQARPGAWLIVAGGWTEKQFREGRRPTQTELEAAAPSNPVYVQLGYQWAVLTAQAWKALNLTTDADLPAGARFERDASGTLTGAVTGPQSAIVALFDKLPKPTDEQKVDGTVKFFRELNRLAITGIVDPGGNNLTAPDYEALLDVWRRRAMTVRVAYALCSQTAGAELAELKELTALLPMGFGDEMLHFNGIGERITAAMYNNERPADGDKERFYDIALWAARRGMALTIHWGRDASVDHLLTVFERVNREVPIAPLRWSIAHLDDASEPTLNRMKALGSAGRCRMRCISAATGSSRSAAARPGCARRRSKPLGASGWSRVRGPTPTVWRPTIRSPRCNGCSMAGRFRAPCCAALPRRRAGPTRCVCIRWGAHGFPSTTGCAAHSKWGSWPTWQSCPGTT